MSRFGVEGLCLGFWGVVGSILTLGGLYPPHPAELTSPFLSSNFHFLDSSVLFSRVCNSCLYKALHSFIIFA